MLQHHLGHQHFFTNPNQLVLDLSLKELIILYSPFKQEDLKSSHLLQSIQVITTTLMSNSEINSQIISEPIVQKID